MVKRKSPIPFLLVIILPPMLLLVGLAIYEGLK